MPTKQKEAGNRRTYQADGGRSVSIEAGDEIAGVFQGEKEITITDSKKGTTKDVRVFMFRDSKGDKFVVLGRTMLDQAFDDMYEAEGGYEKVIGLNVQINRGQDKKLPGKRTMGTYELSVWEE